MDDDIVRLETTDTLDLHTFAPRDAAQVTEAWLDECARLGLRELRLVHGKGIGELRRQVRRVLERHPAVESFREPEASAGGWGATLVVLKVP